jgi:hypothetical protein
VSTVESTGIARAVSPSVAPDGPTSFVRPPARRLHLPYLDGLRGCAALFVVLPRLFQFRWGLPRRHAGSPARSDEHLPAGPVRSRRLHRPLRLLFDTAALTIRERASRRRMAVRFAGGAGEPPRLSCGPDPVPPNVCGYSRSAHARRHPARFRPAGIQRPLAAGPGGPRPQPQRRLGAHDRSPPCGAWRPNGRFISCSPLCSWPSGVGSASFRHCLWPCFSAKPRACLCASSF